jgi:excinuclease ABC subunit B
LEICTVEETVTRIELSDDSVRRISQIDPVTGNMLREEKGVLIFPARHFVTPPAKMEGALKSIENELEDRLANLKKENKLVEAQRLEQRTRFDLEMIREIGYCSGIENYSRHFDGRNTGTPPFTLLDFFPRDYLLVIDESHVTVPQLQGMYKADLSRKNTLVDYGFRLPSARDNRPLRFNEFEQRTHQVIYTSATPGPYEMKRSDLVVEQIIRPTGLVDPEIIIRPVKGQVDDLIGEIRGRVKKKERALVTTLTKKMAEDLADYLRELGIKVHYIHSEVETLKRVELLRDLRLGEYDVLVGINLLREGLDLPEVSLVAILDADKEGFLRSETSLIQTTGRAARNVFGQVIMYADSITGSMRRAISETNRRRRLQQKFNEKHNIKPETVRKDIRAILEEPSPAAEATTERFGKYAKDKLHIIIANLEEEMHMAAESLEFERAAAIRDKINELTEAQGIVSEKIEHRHKWKKQRRRT